MQKSLPIREIDLFLLLQFRPCNDAQVRIRVSNPDVPRTVDVICVIISPSGKCVTINHTGSNHLTRNPISKPNGSARHILSTYYLSEYISVFLLSLSSRPFGDDRPTSDVVRHSDPLSSGAIFRVRDPSYFKSPVPKLYNVSAAAAGLTPKEGYTSLKLNHPQPPAISLRQLSHF
eukprot:1363691-Amorphochlora_amoeboformis.AAC.2